MLDGYCFETMSEETLISSEVGSYIPIDLMNQFQCTELLENMRQKDDAAYQQLLLDVRLGNLNAQQAEMLESRVVKDSFGKPRLTSAKDVAAYLCELLKEDPNTVCLVSTVEKMNAINLECLQLLGGEPRPIKAEETGKKHRNMDKTSLGKRKVICWYSMPFFT